MVETIIGSLILMFVSSLGFIAYKHPEYFMKRLYLLIYAISTIIVTGLVIWNAVLSVSKNELTSIIQKNNIYMAKKIIDASKINSTNTTISYLSLMAYMLILLFIPAGLKDKN